MQPSEETARGSVKPNLLSESTATEKSSSSILNALEGKESPSNAIAQKKSGAVRAALVVALLAAIGAGGFFAWSQRGSQVETAVAADTQTTLAAKELPSSTPVLAANDAAAPEKTESQAAVIENDPASHSEKSDSTPDQVSTDPRIKLTETLEAGVPVTSTALKKALEEPKVSKSKPASKSVDAPLVSRSVQEKKTTTQKATKAAAAQPADSDVNILTALVSHGESVTEPPKTKETAKSKQTAKKKAAEPVLARNTADAPDIVERKSGDSTGGLLQRCKQLGLIEGELCRWRICSGRWDSDPSCKVNR
ncbi:hypothetical protein [Collimonas silvisoli]|uniref:hypothetical protein n=1 Tax=Collimonas silvisoli TaxID=2825884 RepID=UPI001B8D8B57|nr:hypothetical protein [Collimonas silvisoli]